MGLPCYIEIAIIRLDNGTEKDYVELDLYSFYKVVSEKS